MIMSTSSSSFKALTNFKSLSDLPLIIVICPARLNEFAKHTVHNILCFDAVPLKVVVRKPLQRLGVELDFKRFILQHGSLHQWLPRIRALRTRLNKLKVVIGIRCRRSQNREHTPTPHESSGCFLSTKTFEKLPSEQVTERFLYSPVVLYLRPR